ncbi:MAG: hypothetical protein K2M17_02795 [Bacilli bacterium]|nr:hypothetical protein [Bacilli bacterium]
MEQKITKIQALSFIDKLMQYVNGLDYVQISQFEATQLWKDIEKIQRKIQLIKE